MAPMMNFGDYLPDLPPFSHPGVVTAKNTLPRKIGYGPMPGLAATGVEALDARVRGAVNGKDNTGQSYEVAGTATKLWFTTTADPVDVTRTTAAYTTAAAGYWEMAQYGVDFFATNYADEVQYADLTSLSAVAPFQANDADLGYQIPNARHIGVVRDFVVAGNVNDTVNTSDGEVPERVHWGPIGNPSQTWPTAGTSAAKALQSDYQDIRGGRGGAVQRIVGASEIGLIFLEREVWRMDYIGGSEFFQFFPVEEERGALAPGSVASAGRWTFFLSEDGFYMTDGYQSVPIGKDRVDRTFLAAVDEDELVRISAAIDPTRTVYVVAYPEASGGDPDRLLIYDYVLDKWSHGEEDLETLVQVLPSGLNADTEITAGPTWLAGTESTTSTSNSLTNDLLDGTAAIITNLDAASFLGSKWRLGGFDLDHAQARFDGAPNAVQIDTGDVELAAGRHAHVAGVRPVSVVTNSMTVALASKNVPDEAVAFGGAVGPTAATGLCDFREEGRYHRARFEVPTPDLDNDEYQGLDVEAVPTGVR